MRDYLISSYIDDELDLDEKIEFVETVHEQAAFKDEAVDLLQQEKLIRGEVVDRVPVAVVFREKRRFSIALWRPAGMFAAGLAVALLVMFFATPQQKLPVPMKYRFVLYQPHVKEVEITGSFLGWKAVPMQRTGSGYWETVLDVPPGEHRLCYIIDGRKRIPDPTIPIREKDDFGGENSILAVNMRT
jgi:hypothetical protein